MGAAVEPWQMWAWLRPRGCLRQGSCRGVDKGLAAASWASLARVLPGGLVGILSKDLRLLILILSCMFLVFSKICMPPWRRLPSLGSNVVDGVGTPRLKGGGLVGIGQVAPARLLLGP